MVAATCASSRAATQVERIHAVYVCLMTAVESREVWTSRAHETVVPTKYAAEAAEAAERVPKPVVSMKCVPPGSQGI